jgi:hypothetical protein
LDANSNTAPAVPTPDKKHTVDPITVSVETAERLSGYSRRTIYDLCGKGELDARKSGAKTLILFSSLRRHLEGLPRANIKAPTPKAD